VLQAIALLAEAGWRIDDHAVRTGLSEVRTLTGLMGRWQRLSEKPLTICDVGHNTDGLREVTAQLRKMTFRRLHFVIGMVKDKDVAAVLEMLPENAVYYFCQPTLPRALPVEELAVAAAAAGLAGHTFQTVVEAVQTARKEADEEDVVFVGGSTFVVAEALAMFSQK
jgi:dihydrofolate synthase/folylpolyglutamate synthase